MMETDRELLELAAKAAGVSMKKYGPSSDGRRAALDDGSFWAPFDNDGDALRLAVKLRLSIFPPEGDDGDFAVASVPDGVLDDFGETWFQENVKDGDELAATRRAIVRAAAEIGKNRP